MAPAPDDLFRDCNRHRNEYQAAGGDLRGTEDRHGGERVSDAMRVLVDEEVNLVIELEHSPKRRDGRAHDAERTLVAGRCPGLASHIVQQLEVEQATLLASAAWHVT